MGRGLLVLVAVAAAIIASFPVSGLLLRPLESRFQAPSPLPERVDGVVVLGGGIDLQGSVDHDGAELNRSGDRLIALIELARRYPEARLIYSSGSGLLGFPDYREADYAVRLAERLGLAGDRVRVERESRNSRENALFSHYLARPGPGETWLLVTSAFHMPRAVGVFRAVGWEVVPYPVDYVARDRAIWEVEIDLARELADLTLVSKEWTGLLAYRLFGWTRSLFPAPDE